MKKKYTRKQITEAITYWRKMLKESAESDSYEIACMEQISKYIEKIDSSARVFISNQGDDYSRLSPLFGQRDIKASKGRDKNGYDFKNQLLANIINIAAPELNAEKAGMSISTQTIIIDKLCKKYNWFIFHTGYNNWNSDILVVRLSATDNFYDIGYQNIEIKTTKDSYLFQPQFTFGFGMKDGAPTLKLSGMTHQYLSQFNENTKILQDTIINAINNSQEWNNENLQRIFNEVIGLNSQSKTDDGDRVLEQIIEKTGSNYLVKDVMISNVEQIMELFYLRCYDMGRSVNVMQIGKGKNARLFKIGNQKSTFENDPLKLLQGKTNALSSAFNSIKMSIEIRKMSGNKHYGLYGKMKFSNSNANIIGSFDPASQLP